MATVAVVEAERVLLVCRVGQRAFEFAEDLAGRGGAPGLGGVDDVGQELGCVEQRDPVQVRIGAGQGAGEWCRAGEEPVQARDGHALAATADHGTGDHVDPGTCCRGGDAGAVDGCLDAHGIGAEQGDGVGDVERFGIARRVVAKRPGVHPDLEAQTGVDATLRRRAPHRLSTVATTATAAAGGACQYDCCDDGDAP